MAREASSRGPADHLLPWRIETDALLVTVRLTPKGGRDALGGAETLADGRPVLKARVRAVPSEGAANAGLCALLARELGVAASRVTLLTGATARIKVLRIEGDAAALAARLAAHIGKDAA